MIQNTNIEQYILRRSIFCTLLIAALGILFGFFFGSMSIIFDGMFSALDAAMCSLSLLVSRLLGQPHSRRFQHGFWHIEPLVLAFNGSLLTLLCFYAFVNAVKGIIDGGREMDAGWAIVYALGVSLFCFAIFFRQRRLNRRIQSELIALDTKSWFMSAAISSALMLAFLLSWSLQGTRYSYLTPYIDPSVLALLTLIMIPVPLRTVIDAFREVLMVTPDDLDRAIQDMMQRMSGEYGFSQFSYYATRVGRALFVEIHIVLPETMENIGLSRLDRLREQISHEIGENTSDRWLTVCFTRDEKWM